MAFRSTRSVRAALRRPALPGWSLAEYRRERNAQGLIPIGVVLTESGFAGVVADKVFHVHPLLLALITAAPMFGHLSSVLWARLALRVRKVPLVAGIQLVLGLSTAAIALLPPSAVGGYLLALLVVWCRLLVGGFLTVRSIIWTRNYPGEMRARATSRLTLIALLSMTLSAALASMLLDRDPRSVALLYLGGGLASALGASLYARVRMRGEEDPASPPLGSAAHGETQGPRPKWLDILREDPLYLRYLVWQFVLGIANMMIEPALVIAVSHDLRAGYAASIALTLVLPTALSFLTIPLFAAWLDRLHVAEFRARHSWLWGISQALTGYGVLTGSLLWIGVGRSVLGLARGGGQLAWQIGHNDFARPERAGLYMGLHVTLTGLRGTFAPFVGALLYAGFEGATLPLLGVALPAFPGVGGWTMIVGAVLSTLATLGFVALARQVAAGRRAERRAATP